MNACMLRIGYDWSRGWSKQGCKRFRRSGSRNNDEARSYFSKIKDTTTIKYRISVIGERFTSRMRDNDNTLYSSIQKRSK